MKLPAAIDIFEYAAANLLTQQFLHRGGFVFDEVRFLCWWTKNDSQVQQSYDTFFYRSGPKSIEFRCAGT
jgi:hypothetical protein